MGGGRGGKAGWNKITSFPEIFPAGFHEGGRKLNNMRANVEFEAMQTIASSAESSGGKPHIRNSDSGADT